MLEELKQFFKYDEFLIKKEEQFNQIIRNPHWDKHLKRIEQFKAPAKDALAVTLDSTVSVRADSEMEMKIRPEVMEIVKGLFPWRKGPFNLMGVEIDAEWRSDLKWDRFADALPCLENRRIADVGCNNGYYMLRLLSHNPQCIIGLDPSSRTYYQFEFIQKLLREPKLTYEPLGIEHMDLFPDFFDLVLCLGVIYHRRDPYTSCRMLYDSLRTDGCLLFESLVIPGDDPHCLCPADRYAKMRNVWYVPTDACLKVWLHKAGFREIELISSQKLTTTEEQRKTELAPYESLEDFLDPLDSLKTIEGHPAPRRTILLARK